KARKRVLDAAETLFVDYGYEGVTVKEIAKKAGIHHASIYYHIPDGKASLFVEVMTRYLNRHREGIQASLAEADEDIQAQLMAVASWLLSQQPMDLMRLVNADIPALDEQGAEELRWVAFDAMLSPIEAILETAKERGEINHPNLGNVAGAILNAIEGLHMIPSAYIQRSRLEMAEELMTLFVRGMQLP
ncbi:MAG: TetR/AcrR family transcriptional regulator, partial [Chloroflexota bacterium]